MPRGVYLRKSGVKRNINAEAKQVFRHNLEKARQKIAERGLDLTEDIKAARSRNACKASVVRTARAILKRCPLGAKVGDVFSIPGGPKSFEVISTAPIKNGDVWKQFFAEIIRQKIGGVKQEMRNIIAVVWDYEPTIENSMHMPRYEAVEQNPEDKKEAK